MTLKILGDFRNKVKLEKSIPETAKYEIYIIVRKNSETANEINGL